MKTTWNGECWFLLPYSLLSLSYPLVFRVMDRYRPWPVVGTTFMGTFLMMTLLHFYQGTISASPLLSLPVVIIEFLFCFCCGALAKRHEVIERFRHFLHRRGIANGGLLLALCALVLIRILIPHASWEDSSPSPWCCCSPACGIDPG